MPWVRSLVVVEQLACRCTNALAGVGQFRGAVAKLPTLVLVVYADILIFHLL